MTPPPAKGFAHYDKVARKAHAALVESGAIEDGPFDTIAVERQRAYRGIAAELDAGNPLDGMRERYKELHGEKKGDLATETVIEAFRDAELDAAFEAKGVGGFGGIAGGLDASARKLGRTIAAGTAKAADAKLVDGKPAGLNDPLHAELDRVAGIAHDEVFPSEMTIQQWVAMDEKEKEILIEMARRVRLGLWDHLRDIFLAQPIGSQERRDFVQLVRVMEREMGVSVPSWVMGGDGRGGAGGFGGGRPSVVHRVPTNGLLLVEYLAAVLSVPADPIDARRTGLVKNSIEGWEWGGSLSYLFSEDLARVLHSTDAPPDMRWADVPLPADEFYVEFEGDPLDASAQEGVSGLLITVGPAGSLGDENDLPGVRFVCISSSIRTRPDAPVGTMAARMAERVTHVKGGNAGEGFPEARAALVNACLYLHHRAEAAKLEPSIRAGRLARAHNLKPKKRAKAVRQAERLSAYDRYVVHVDQRDRIQHRGGNGDGPERAGTRLHMVRGHWRNQACGEGRRDHKRIFIAPHVRGDASLGVVEKIYSNDPKKAAKALDRRARRDNDEGSDA